MSLIAMAHPPIKPVPAGNHIGHCYRIIDLGTQESLYEGEIRLRRKVLIGWELYTQEEQGESPIAENVFPLTITKIYTLSLNDRATLRADLESWRGRAFSEEELHGGGDTEPGFNLESLLGLFCMVNVVLTARDGKTWSNVASLSPVPRGLSLPFPKNTHALEFFDIQDPDEALLNRLPKKIQEKIYASQEWREHIG